jgi:hypothetical protein
LRQHASSCPKHAPSSNISCPLRPGSRFLRDTVRSTRCKVTSGRIHHVLQLMQCDLWVLLRTPDSCRSNGRTNWMLARDPQRFTIAPASPCASLASDAVMDATDGPPGEPLQEPPAHIYGAREVESWPCHARCDPRLGPCRDCRRLPTEFQATARFPLPLLASVIDWVGKGINPVLPSAREVQMKLYPRLLRPYWEKWYRIVSVIKVPRYLARGPTSNLHYYLERNHLSLGCMA